MDLRIKKVIALICVLAFFVCWLPVSAHATETQSGNEIAHRAAAPAVKLRFASISLTLENDLTITFYVRPAVMEYYSDIRVEYTMNDVTTVVASPTGVNGSGQSAFAYQGVSPRMMKDNIKATIYGTYDGVEYSYSMNYRVSDYCYTTLRTTTDAKLKTLLVDLLNYGTAHQEYIGYKTEDPVNGELTDDQSAFASSYKQSFTMTFGQTGTTDTASWRAATLVLTNAIVLRFSLRCQDINGVSVCFTVDGEEFWVDSSEFEKEEGYSDRYKIYFKELKARQLESVVSVTAYRGAYPTSKTCTYSVESYASSVINDYGTLGRLTRAMMYYGRSAYNYVNS